MNINELARITGTPKDTIRVYRERGLLSPKRNEENRYFTYTMKDVCTLLFIKKMRYFKLSLANIRTLLDGNCPHQFLSEYEQQIEHLEEEKERIQLQIDHLKIARRFLHATVQQTHEISEMSFQTYRYDMYPTLLSHKDLPTYHAMLQDSSIYINCIHIEKDDLLSDTFMRLPLHVGLGIDDAIIEQYNLTVPNGAVVFAPGMYLVTMLELTQLDSIPAEALIPLLTYAKLHHYEIVGGITSFLAYIDTTRGIFHYRVRLPVAKKVIS